MRPSPSEPAPPPGPSADAFDVHLDAMVQCLADREGLARLDPDEVRERLTGLRRLEGATTAAIAAAVAALDRAGGIRADGAPSTAEWLKANTGRSGRQAAQLARLARDLDDLPDTAAALADGRIGADAADTIVKATRDGRLGTPNDVEATLLPVATSAPPDHLHRHVRARQQEADGAALLRDERRQRARRRLSMVQRHDGGMWQVHGDLPNELGAKLRTALDAFDHPDDRAVPLGQRRRPDQRLADALELMTDAVLDRGLAPGTGGITRPHLSVLVDVATIDADLVHDDARTTDAPAPDARAPDAPLPDARAPDASPPDAPAANPSPPDAPAPDAQDAAVMPDHAAWAALPAGTTPWGGHLSPQVVRRLLCDAAVSRIVMAGDSQVLDVGRTTRRWSGPQRRAVNARDRGCRGPNCTRPIAWTHVHHLQWWRHDGPTSVANGLALCHHCHRLVHDRGWTVSLDRQTAAATWTSPDGAVTTTRPHRPTPRQRP